MDNVQHGYVIQGDVMDGAIATHLAWTITYQKRETAKNIGLG